MKIAVSSTGDSVGSKAHELFGRCDFFLIGDSESFTFVAVKNKYAGTFLGAGTACAQMLLDEGIEVVISGQVGPHAFEVLSKAGINVFLAPPEHTVQEILEKYKADGLRKMELTRF